MGGQLIVDCDAPPSVPYTAWRIAKHEKRGKIVWDPSQFILRISQAQECGGGIRGTDFQKQLGNERAANANVLDFLLPKPELFLSEWKSTKKNKPIYIFFLATVYTDSQFSYVRCLLFENGCLRSNFCRLDQMFFANDRALVHVT